MTKEELILDCRYYNGEDDVPATLSAGDAIFWDYERVWAGWVLEGCDRLQKNIDHYSKAYDLPNLLPENDGTPLGLKALLFNRYEHWNCYMGGSNQDPSSTAEPATSRRCPHVTPHKY